MRTISGADSVWSGLGEQGMTCEQICAQIGPSPSGYFSYEEMRQWDKGERQRWLPPGSDWKRQRKVYKQYRCDKGCPPPSGGIFDWVGDIDDWAEDVYEWAKEKACGLLTNDKVQKAAMLAMLYPSPDVKATAGIVLALARQCGMNVPEIPEYGGDPADAPPSEPESVLYQTKPWTRYTAKPYEQANARIATVGRFPPGAVASYDARKDMFRVAVPSAAGNGLGAAAPEYYEILVTPYAPTHIPLIPASEYDSLTGKRAWYKHPVTWIAGIGLAAGGGYLAWRRWGR